MIHVYQDFVVCCVSLVVSLQLDSVNLLFWIAVLLVQLSLRWFHLHVTGIFVQRIWNSSRYVPIAIAVIISFNVFNLLCYFFFEVWVLESPYVAYKDLQLDLILIRKKIISLLRALYSTGNFMHTSLENYVTLCHFMRVNQ